MADRSSTQTCIIGAGLAGLTAAYDLGRAGFDVTLVESAPELGGLASSLDLDGTPVERFYHFICGGDNDLIELVGELGLSDRLHWRQTRTSFFLDGRLYPFSSPLDLLRFAAVPLNQRIRFGLNIMRSRFRKEWRQLDDLPARQWLIDQIGQQAYDAIWDPLLRIKFGDAHDTVSAAWIWHRIHRIATSRRRIWERDQLGFLEGGSEAVIDALAERARSMPNVNIDTAAPVRKIHTGSDGILQVELERGDQIRCSSVISTVALRQLVRLVPDFDDDFRQKLEPIEYLGVVCGLLKLKQPVTDSFWVNINDPDIPFNGIIEYTNLNDSPSFGSSSIVYIPHYLRTSHPRYSASDAELRDEFERGLKLVNPEFDPSWIEQCYISRASHAQAICTIGFSAHVPSHQTPIPGLFLTDSAQFYPEDRTISAAIRLGRTVAAMVADQHKGHSRA